MRHSAASAQAPLYSLTTHSVQTTCPHKLAKGATKIPKQQGQRCGRRSAIASSPGKNNSSLKSSVCIFFVGLGSTQTKPRPTSLTDGTWRLWVRPIWIKHANSLAQRHYHGPSPSRVRKANVARRVLRDPCQNSTRKGTQGQEQTQGSHDGIQ